MTHLLGKLVACAGLGAALAVATGIGPAARAQDDNPFEGLDAVAPADDAALEADSAPADDEPAGDLADVEGAAPIAAPAGGPTLADFARRDPTLAAVLALPRETPAGAFRAVLTLINLGYPEVAGQLLPELVQMRLDDAQRAALVREFGSAAFLRMIRLDPPSAREGEASPLAGLGAFAQQCLDAAAAQARDPGRVAALVAQLSAPTPQERYAAQVDLQEAGEVGVVACFLALAKADTPELRGQLIAALMTMRPLVDEPLEAVLADAQGQLRQDAADLAGRLRMRTAVPWLSVIAVSGDNPAAAQAAQNALLALGLPAPTASEVERLVREKLRSIDSEPVSTIDEGTVGVWWSWDPVAGQLAAREFPPTQLRTLAAARWSRAVAAVGGLADPGDRRRVVVYELEEAALLGRSVSPTVQPAIAAMGPGALSEALAEAVKGDYRAAAIALAGELAAQGDASVLASSSGRPAPLAAAVSSPARDVRFAALAAIMKLAPAQSFPGASHVTEALWDFAAGAGPPAAIAASPDLVRASEWAGQLRAAGFDALPVRTGRDVLAAAVDPAFYPRLAAVVLDGDLGQPLVGEVTYQLHASRQAAGVPIVIGAVGPRLATAERIAADDPLVLAAPRPEGAAAVASLVDQARAMSGRPFLPAEQRTAQAVQALQWIAAILATGGPYDELPRDAALLSRTLATPELAAATLPVLAALGTRDSQRALVDHASAAMVPLEGRRAAAAQFAASVARFGLRLSREETLRQYDRYNASETADADTQQVLGQLLDTIERRPTAAAPLPSPQETPTLPTTGL